MECKDSAIRKTYKHDALMFGIKKFLKKNLTSFFAQKR